MTTCTGRGPDGDHCCWIKGKLCEFFVTVNGLPRCSLWNLADRLIDIVEWRRAPVGKYFAKNYPGFTCEDWPQNIPVVMAQGRGLCCWNPPVEVEIR